MTSPVRFTLNGRPVAIEPRPGESLLDALRERCGVVSIKDGCQPQGQCGCCLALIDGRPLVTCAFEAHRAEGHDVLTLEGVSVREREIVRGEIKAIYEIRCPCGRRWFNPRLENVQVCPRCGRAVLVMQPGLAAD